MATTRGVCALVENLVQIRFQVSTGPVSTIPIPIPFTHICSLCALMQERLILIHWSKNNSRLRSAFFLPWSVIASVLYRTCVCRSRRFWVTWRTATEPNLGRRRPRCQMQDVKGADMSVLWRNSQLTAQKLTLKYWICQVSIISIPIPTLVSTLSIFGSINLNLANNWILARHQYVDCTSRIDCSSIVFFLCLLKLLI